MTRRSSPRIWESVLLLEINDLTVTYGGALALNGISLDVADGEAVGLVGSNGAGKTTLLKAISGIVDWSGHIVFDGQDLGSTKPHKIPALGIAHVPEGRRLFPRLSIEDNLLLGGNSTHTVDDSDFDRVYTLFPILAERRSQMAGTLSGGEQQMAAIARGLMLRPRLLMLDEPSLGIAPVLVEGIYDAIATLQRDGQTILLAEQNVMECLEVCSRTYVMQTGTVVASGQSTALAENDDIRRAFLGI